MYPQTNSPRPAEPCISVEHSESLPSSLTARSTTHSRRGPPRSIPTQDMSSSEARITDNGRHASTPRSLPGIWVCVSPSPNRSPGTGRTSRISASWPWSFEDPSDYERIDQDDVLRIDGPRETLSSGSPLIAHNQIHDVDIALCHRLSQSPGQRSAGWRSDPVTGGGLRRAVYRPRDDALTCCNPLVDGEQ
jgi:hypothetical protein